MMNKCAGLVKIGVAYRLRGKVVSVWNVGVLCVSLSVLLAIKYSMTVLVPSFVMVLKRMMGLLFLRRSING